MSQNTLLRLLRRQPLPADPTPTMLGVDDFALRKRHTYGTILVDLERYQPVALLPDRTAETVAQWLRAHPGVEVITRDRSSTYAEGARQGAPTATQVADRFHLLQNLADALPQVFTTYGTALDAVNAAANQRPVPLPDGSVAVPVPPPPTPPAAQVGCSRRTIERYLQMPTWPVQQHRRHYGRSILHPYKAYLLERWNAGCHTAIQLFQEIPPRGYTGSYRRVTAYVSRIRQAQSIPPCRQGRRQILPVVAEPVSQPLTPRRATWLVLRRQEQRTEAEAQQLAQLHAQSAEVAEAIDLAQDLTHLMRPRQPEHLEPWLARLLSKAFHNRSKTTGTPYLPHGGGFVGRYWLTRPRRHSCLSLSFLRWL